MIQTNKKIAPKNRESSGFTKADAVQIFQLTVSKTNGFSITTGNIKAWKANFYSLRKTLCPDREFTFLKYDDFVYNVWRIK